MERLSSFRGSKCTKTIGHVIFGTSNSVLCREVYYTVSLFRRVHNQRFHYNYVYTIDQEIFMLNFVCELFLLLMATTVYSVCLKSLIMAKFLFSG